MGICAVDAGELELGFINEPILHLRSGIPPQIPRNFDLQILNFDWKSS
jgi:hypothetical protein